MAVTAVLNRKDKRSGVLTARFTITASGSYSTNGDTLDFTPLVGLTNRQPDFVQVYGIAGFTYSYDATNKKLLAFCITTSGANTPQGQVSAGAYPAGITGDTIRAIAFWLKGSQI